MRGKHVGRNRLRGGPSPERVGDENAIDIVAWIAALSALAFVVAAVGPFVHPWWPGEMRRAIAHWARSAIARRS